MIVLEYIYIYIFRTGGRFSGVSLLIQKEKTAHERLAVTKFDSLSLMRIPIPSNRPRR